MIRTHRAGKGPDRCGGWGLGSREQKGPRHTSRLWFQRVGDPPWELSRHPGPHWAGQTPSLLSCSSSAGGPLPPPLLFSPVSLPRTMRPGVGFGGLGNQPGSLAVSVGPSGWCTRSLLLSCSSGPGDWVGETLGELPMIRAPEGPISHGNPSPLSATLQGRRSYPASTSPPPSVPPRPTGSLGASYHLLGHWGPPPASGRCPSCRETQTLRLSTPPSS